MYESRNHLKSKCKSCVEEQFHELGGATEREYSNSSKEQSPSNVAPWKQFGKR